MSVIDRASFLRQALLADAAVSGTTGLLIFGGASFLADSLALPEPLLVYSGLSLLPYAAFVAYVATRQSLNRTTFLAVVLLNAFWLLDIIVLLLTG